MTIHSIEAATVTRGNKGRRYGVRMPARKSKVARTAWICPIKGCDREISVLGARIKQAIRPHLLTHGITDFSGPFETWGRASQPVATSAQNEPATDSSSDAPDPQPTLGEAGPPSENELLVAIQRQLVQLEQDVQQLHTQPVRHGLCDDAHCLPCRRDRVIVAQSSGQNARLSLADEIDEAAARYGLGPQRDLLLEAVQRLRDEKTPRPERNGLVRLSG